MSAATHDRPALPAAEEAAFLLDFDGTLVDIAPAPELVHVEPDLAENLVRLRERCGNALAIVSGRPIAQIDGFLSHVPYAVAGEHGTALRRRPGGDIERAALPPLPDSWLAEAEALARQHGGVRVEAKAAGFVLHYRAAPDAGETLRQAAVALLRGHEDDYELQAAKMAWEIRPRGIDKGSAVETLMQSPPFAGRRPVFVGDDVTDEDGIRAAIALGGTGYRIPEDFPSPAAVRRWLAGLASGEVGTWRV